MCLRNEKKQQLFLSFALLSTTLFGQNRRLKICFFFLYFKEILLKKMAGVEAKMAASPEAAWDVYELIQAFLQVQYLN